MATNKKFQLKKRALPSSKELFNELKGGDRSALSKAITIIESSLPEHTSMTEELMALAVPESGNSIRIGITGVPGVGKSTFIESFGSTIIQAGKKLAVLAIDPTSQQTGGSILGDKTRMETLSRNPNVFIRPSPAGDSLGGVARATREAMILCEAAGFDMVLIETVGVGQSETEVRSMVDYFLLLMLAGAGDELQGIKRGIMEMADLIVINKADGKNKEKALLAKKFLQSALHYFPPKPSNWLVKTLTCSAIENKGIEEIFENCNQYVSELSNSGHFQRNRDQQNLSWFKVALNDHLTRRMLSNPNLQEMIEKKEREILDRNISPFQAADEVARQFD